MARSLYKANMMIACDMTVGNELPRDGRVRYCKVCAKNGLNVRLSIYNTGDACTRHPIPDNKRMRWNVVRPLPLRAA